MVEMIFDDDSLVARFQGLFANVIWQCLPWHTRDDESYLNIKKSKFVFVLALGFSNFGRIRNSPEYPIEFVWCFNGGHLPVDYYDIMDEIFSPLSPHSLVLM